MGTFLAEVKQGDTCSSSYAVNRYRFPDLFSATFLPAFLCFLLVILLFKMAPGVVLKKLSSVPKPKKAVMCLTEKIYMC